jgi:hypothetical protein
MVLESARQQGFLGASLEAKVLLHVADPVIAEQLAALQRVRTPAWLALRAARWACRTSPSLCLQWPRSVPGPCPSLCCVSGCPSVLLLNACTAGITGERCSGGSLNCPAGLVSFLMS